MLGTLFIFALFFAAYFVYMRADSLGKLAGRPWTIGAWSLAASGVLSTFVLKPAVVGFILAGIVVAFFLYLLVSGA